MSSKLPWTLPFSFDVTDTSGPFEEDRFRIIVEEAISGEIVCKDLVTVKPPKAMRVLSGPCNIQLEVNPEDPSVEGIFFKPYSHWIHMERRFHGDRIIWCSGLVRPSQVDKKTGIISLQCQGFSGYPKGMPWLENWNPLVVDVFEIVHRIWNHLQRFPQGDLGVEVYPALSGIEMLPGYAFDGNIFNLNFTAEFIRAVDKLDCGDHIDALARDIPFDYVEQSQWEGNFDSISKKIFLGYPKAGVTQSNLAFIQNENVIEMAPHIETEIDWSSDATVDGWFPGQIVSSTFANADPLRYRRVLQQDDSRINSQERAAALARRKLSRRQTPSYWESIIVEMSHPNAPFGSYDVGDRIMVSGNMPIVGEVVQEHKIIAIALDEEAQVCEITMKAEGAFNYDPIYYQGSVVGAQTITHATVPLITASASPGMVGVT